MTIVELLDKFGVVAFGFLIFFGGRFGLRFFTHFKKKTHNFLVFATLFAMIYIFLEVMVGTFEWEDLAKYFFTYTVVTTCYENLCDFLPFLKDKNQATTLD